MKILIFGAGAIGSLFGARLSRYNNVTLLSRKKHAESINKNGLKISGKTEGVYHLKAIYNLRDFGDDPDLIILTVKAYDTENAVKEIVEKFGKHINLLSLQNGLDNLDKIKKYVDPEEILMGVTTEASIFVKPGEIIHTGIGKTVIGSIAENPMLNQIYKKFKEAGFETILSNDIMEEIWKKGIVNACINPLTATLEVKNGYLKNDVLFEIIKDVCKESLDVARANGIDLDFDEMLREVSQVIDSTSENISSMLQSIIRGRKTEIDSINGYISDLGKRFGIETRLNELLTKLVKIREEFR